MTELKRLYAAGHGGRMDWGDAVRASKILRELRFCIEGDQLEQRLAELEARLAAVEEPGGPPRRTNGRHRPGLHS